jgi:hypothetical protein
MEVCYIHGFLHSSSKLGDRFSYKKKHIDLYRVARKFEQNGPNCKQLQNLGFQTWQSSSNTCRLRKSFRRVDRQPCSALVHFVMGLYIFFPFWLRIWDSEGGLCFFTSPKLKIKRQIFYVTWPGPKS